MVRNTRPPVAPWATPSTSPLRAILASVDHTLPVSCASAQVKRPHCSSTIATRAGEFQRMAYNSGVQSLLGFGAVAHSGTAFALRTNRSEGRSIRRDEASATVTTVDLTNTQHLDSRLLPPTVERGSVTVIIPANRWTEASRRSAAVVGPARRPRRTPASNRSPDAHPPVRSGLTSVGDHPRRPPSPACSQSLAFADTTADSGFSCPPP